MNREQKDNETREDIEAYLAQRRERIDRQKKLTPKELGEGLNLHPLKQKIGENIKRFRKQKGMTQSDLANITKLSRSYIADVERDRYNPSVDTLRILAQSLGVDPNSILGVSGSETTTEKQERRYVCLDFTDHTEEELDAIEDTLDALLKHFKKSRVRKEGSE